MLTITSARYGNAEHSAAVVKTAERGSIAISEADTPELWADMLASGVAIAAFEVVPLARALAAMSAEQRFNKEVGGIIVNGRAIATDRASQGMISNAFSYAMAVPGVVTKFKTADGFVDLSLAELTAIAVAVGAHVQACFAKEAEIAAAIDAGTIASFQDIATAYAALS